MKRAPFRLSIGLIRFCPFSPGRAERHGFEYFRHGTLSLYAALEVSSGQVLGKTTQRHTSAEFVAFLADVVATQPQGKQIQVIADNLSAHKTKAVAEFLAAHTNVQLHYTPTYSSWLNQVEIWFSKIQREFDHPRHLYFQSRPRPQNRLVYQSPQQKRQAFQMDLPKYRPSHPMRLSDPCVTVH
jgi:transposase